MSEKENYYIVKCSCGNDVKLHKGYIYETPFDYMCEECHKRDNWRHHTRLLQLEKFKCVKCGWKLKKKNIDWFDENKLAFHCPCCGYNFVLWHRDYYPDDYPEEAE